MSSPGGTGFFVVEHRLVGSTDAELALLEAALSDACVRLTARGERVDYVGSAYLPGPGRLLSMFEAASEDAVRRASSSSHVLPARLDAAIKLRGHHLRKGERR